MTRARPPVRRQTYVFVYALIAIFLVLAHGPILDTPFYWDEAGQFIPAALDVFHSGALIPHSTLPNVHPPGVMAYLAAFWHVFGFSVSGTRVAMLLLAAVGALCSFLLAIELGREAPGTPAFSSLVMLCISPLFFAQSMLAQLDMPAMCFGILALLLFLQDSFIASALVLRGAGAHERDGPGGCGRIRRLARDGEALEGCCMVPGARSGAGGLAGFPALRHRALDGQRRLCAIQPVLSLTSRTSGSRIIRRVYYLFVGSGHFIGTAVLLWAMRRMSLFRSRPWRVTGAFLAVHVIVVSVLGGAVLERYLLPVLPILYIAFAVAMRAMLPVPRKRALFALLACLVAANFVNPIYSFPFENNLAFVNFARLGAEVALNMNSRPGQIATTFPMSDALRHPEYGYTQLPRDIVELKSFSADEIRRLTGRRPDMVLVYDTAWDPLHLLQLSFVKSAMRQYFGSVTPATPEEVADLLSMQIVRHWMRTG